MTSDQLAFSKGHGTRNDFVLILDADGTLDVGPARVAALCDRRAGIGGDGLIRAVPTTSVPDAPAQRPGTHWFMDYRNADGSIAQMCGNGVRVMAQFLRHREVVTDDELRAGLAIGTRAGTKIVRLRYDGWFAVDMGLWQIPGGQEAAAAGYDVRVRPAGATLDVPGLRVSVGNPHTVVVVPDQETLAALDLSRVPDLHPVPPDGSNVEFVVVDEPVAGAEGDGEEVGRLAMRVYERGVGETASCGTGVCASMLAARVWAGEHSPRRWVVAVPGGSLEAAVLDSGHVELVGPAEIVADGSTSL